MDETEFDPRAAHMPGSTKGNGGVVPGSWAGSGDHPDTKAPPVRTAALIVPTWCDDIRAGRAWLYALRQEVQAIDFYREPS